MFFLYTTYKIKKMKKDIGNNTDNRRNIQPDAKQDTKSESLDNTQDIKNNFLDNATKQQYYITKISRLRDFNEAFELVKKAVEARYNMHRAGLSLILQSMPLQLGAYHILGSNMIIMNKAILEIIRVRKTTLEYNSYLFVVLCHEYLHSFGITDELRVRKMTYEICNELIGDNHPSTLMARFQPWEIFPELKTINLNKFENRFEFIKKFDTTTQSYIN